MTDFSSTATDTVTVGISKSLCWIAFFTRFRKTEPSILFA